jgi:hypothetical protein
MSMGFGMPPGSLSEVIAALNPHGQLISDYEPIDKQGMWLTPIPQTNAAGLEAAITATLQGVGWIVTSLKDNRVLIEPQVTRPINIEPPGCVFHVTWRSKRPDISKDGLDPKTGGNTRMQRKYPPRTFFALDLFAAFEFVEFQCRLPPQFRNGKLIHRFDEALMAQIDIWRVRLPGGLVLHRDVLFPGRAGWTDQPIPRRFLTRVRWWRVTRCAWHVLRRTGAV